VKDLLRWKKLEFIIVTHSENFKARNGDKNYISSKILPNNYREKSYKNSFFFMVIFRVKGCNRGM
jgi:hypothetical protein